MSRNKKSRNKKHKDASKQIRECAKPVSAKSTYLLEKVRSAAAEELAKALTSEDDAREFLEKLRWPDGFVCPACGCKGGKRHKTRKYFVCDKCRKPVSATAGTVFQGARKLEKWLAIAAGMRRGESACSLSKKVQMAYSSVWAILHRFRMVIGALFPDHTVVPDIFFKSILFRLSSELLDGKPVVEQESCGDDPLTLSPGIEPAVTAAMDFIRDHFHGVSRKFIANYSAAVWYATDTAFWSLTKLLAQALQTAPIDMEMIRQFSSPSLVKLMVA